MKGNLRFGILLTVIFSIIFSGCKEKGCTDKNALNYNSLATEDDGSCIICNTYTDTLGIELIDLIDFNSSGPHYQDVVAVFEIYQVKEEFNHEQCGQSTCNFRIKIQSMVSEKMTFGFNLQANGNIFFSWNENNIQVAGNSSITLGNLSGGTISNPCGSLQATSFFLSSTFIIYN